MHSFESLTFSSKLDFMTYETWSSEHDAMLQFPTKAQIIAARTSLIVNKQSVWALSHKQGPQLSCCCHVECLADLKCL